jgi:hypothetical protein
MSELRDPQVFWDKLNALPEIKKEIPAKARRAIEAMLPHKGLHCRIVHRVAGLGSLGRPRFAALVKWQGGLIVREAKALVPSAWAWANDERAAKLQYRKILKQAIRCPDPFLTLSDGWVTRRLAPDCSRVTLEALPKRDAFRLLEAMGWETANIHAGNLKAAKKIQLDLATRPKRWLETATKAMTDATTREWRQWSGHA